MKKYKEAPWWWYLILLVLAFLAGELMSLEMEELYDLICRTGLIVVFQGQTTLPWWSYIVALLLGAFITVSLPQIMQNSERLMIRPSSSHSLVYYLLVWVTELPPINS